MCVNPGLFNMTNRVRARTHTQSRFQYYVSEDNNGRGMRRCHAISPGFRATTRILNFLYPTLPRQVAGVEPAAAVPAVAEAAAVATPVAATAATMAAVPVARLSRTPSTHGHFDFHFSSKAIPIVIPI